MGKIFHSYFHKMFYTQQGRHILVLKFIVAVGIIGNHYFPGHLGLITNLLWLFAF